MNPWRSLFSLPRSLWVIFVAVLVNRAGTMAFPFLVLYLTRHRGFVPTDAGLLITAYGLGALFTGPLAGKLSDRFGSAGIMKLSLFLTGLILIFFPFLSDHGLLAAATVLWAIVSEAFRPASMALVSDIVEPKDRKIAITVIRLAVNAGMSVGPAVGGFLLLVSYDLIFWIDAATSIGAGLLLSTARLSAVGGRRSAVAQSTSWRHWFRSFTDVRLVYFLISMFPLFLVFFQHSSGLPLYLVQDLHLDERAYGLLFPVNTILILTLEVPLNLAMAHWPHRRSLILGSLLTTAGFAATGLAWNFPTMVITVIIWTFGEMILIPSSTAFVADISPPDRRGEYMGLYQMCFSLAFAVSGWAGTAVYEHWGGGVLWGSVLVVGMCSVLLNSRARENPRAVMSEAREFT